jgi:hypothetical protein
VLANLFEHHLPADGVEGVGKVQLKQDTVIITMGQGPISDGVDRAFGPAGDGHTRLVREEVRSRLLSQFPAEALRSEPSQSLARCDGAVSTLRLLKGK